MTKPISIERANWLSERLKVVEECIKIAQSQMYQMQGGGVARDEMQRALMEFNSERVMISIELHVLSRFDVKA